MHALQGGLSSVRREMLLAIRMEDEEAWEELEFHDGEVGRHVISHCIQLKKQKKIVGSRI